ncbi:hypothetical protein DFH06DRAFT_1339951 [Mycena polygramma]|nr:hypothetical protein DFH06DRAFT_1339951 [Mycena polygramma]
MFAFRSLLVLTAVAIGIATPTQRADSANVQCVNALAASLVVLNTQCTALAAGASAVSQANAINTQAVTVEAKISACTSAFTYISDADCTLTLNALLTLAGPVKNSLDCICAKKTILDGIPGADKNTAVALKKMDDDTTAYIVQLGLKCKNIAAQLKLSQGALKAAFGQCEAKFPPPS